MVFWLAPVRKLSTPIEKPGATQVFFSPSSTFLVDNTWREPSLSSIVTRKMKVDIRHLVAARKSSTNFHSPTHMYAGFWFVELECPFRSDSVRLFETEGKRGEKIDEKKCVKQIKIETFGYVGHTWQHTQTEQKILIINNIIIIIIISLCIAIWQCSLASGNISSVLKVRLGEYDVSVTTEQLAYEELDVSHVMVHPQFNNLSLANDIALLRFVQPARRRPHIDVVCMPHPGQVSETEGTRCVVTGWGRKLEGISSSSSFQNIYIYLRSFWMKFCCSWRWDTFSHTERDWGAIVGRCQMPGGVEDPIRTQFHPTTVIRLRRRRRKRRMWCQLLFLLMMRRRKLADFSFIFSYLLVNFFVSVGRETEVGHLSAKKKASGSR